jgi:hypothetical protein
MILTIIGLSIFLLISVLLNIYFGVYLYKSIDKIEEYSTWFNEIKKHVDDTYNQLKIVDDRQLFEKDDDVGFVFQSIVELIVKLKSKI